MQKSADFFKAYMGTTDSDYIAQLGVQVDPEIINLSPAQDILRARWAPKARTKRTLAATYTTLDSISFVIATNPFFEEGKCPPAITYSKTQSSKVKKHYGLESGLTNAAIAAASSPCDAQGINTEIMDEEERNLRALEIGMRNAEDWAIINGDDGADANAFDGLDEEVTAAHGSLVVNLAGADLTKSDIDEIIAVQALRGIRVTAIVSNPMMINHIKQQYYPGINVMSEDKQNDPYNYQTIPSVQGNVELVGDPHVAATYAGSGEDYSTTIFLLCEELNGVDLLYMEYLIPESILPAWVFADGTNCTSQDYGIYAIGALISRANVAQAKITNAGFNAAASLNATIAALSSKVL